MNHFLFIQDKDFCGLCLHCWDSWHASPKYVLHSFCLFLCVWKMRWSWQESSFMFQMFKTRQSLAWIGTWHSVQCSPVGSRSLCTWALPYPPALQSAHYRKQGLEMELEPNPRHFHIRGKRSKLHLKQTLNTCPVTLSKCCFWLLIIVPPCEVQYEFFKVYFNEKAYLQIEGEAERSSVCWLILQVAAMAWPELSQSEVRSRNTWTHFVWFRSEYLFVISSIYHFFLVSTLKELCSAYFEILSVLLLTIVTLWCERQPELIPPV